jgi:hypothetical protein
MKKAAACNRCGDALLFSLTQPAGTQMKYWIRLFLLIGAIISVIAAIGWALPHNYSLATSTTIKASPREVYAQIDLTPKWKAWSQWNSDEIKDLTVEYGADGKSQSWTDVRGTGKLWFVDQKQDQRIDYRMRFANFPEMDASIVLKAKGESTEVTWTSEGKLPSSPFYGFFRHIFVQQMQLQYDQSLQKLKTAVEQPAAETPEDGKSDDSKPGDDPATSDTPNPSNASDAN